MESVESAGFCTPYGDGVVAEPPLPEGACRKVCGCPEPESVLGVGCTGVGANVLDGAGTQPGGQLEVPPEMIDPEMGAQGSGQTKEVSITTVGTLGVHTQR